MSTMNISLPDSLKAFVDQKVAEGGYSTSSEYVRELLRREQDEARFRGLLEQGAASAVEGDFDRAYFDGLRQRIAVKAAKRKGKTRAR